MGTLTYHKYNDRADLLFEAGSFLSISVGLVTCGVVSILGGVDILGDETAAMN